MNEIRHILCPIDFSDVSTRALEHAAALAEGHASKLTALHVMPLHLPPLSALAAATAATFEPDVRDRLRADLLERLKSFVAPVAGPGIDTIVEEGDAANEIVARARVVDLVVIGTHGHGRIGRLALGSTTDKTIRRAACPVIVVPAAAEKVPGAGRFQRIVCAIDFSASARRAFEWALALARKSNGRIVLVHVLESVPAAMTATAFAAFDVQSYRHALEEDARIRLQQLVPPRAGSFLEREEVFHGKPAEEISNVAEAHGADLIAMGVQGHGPLTDAVFGSTAYDVARRASCPVLTVRATAASD